MYMKILIYSKIVGIQRFALYNNHMKTFKYSEICSQIILFGLKLPRVFSMDKSALFPKMRLPLCLRRFFCSSHFQNMAYNSLHEV
jgi:hypothetical protein